MHLPSFVSQRSLALASFPCFSILVVLPLLREYLNVNLRICGKTWKTYFAMLFIICGTEILMRFGLELSLSLVDYKSGGGLSTNLSQIMRPNSLHKT